MKKVLSVLLAVMMIFSSSAVIGASAADGYAAKNPITGSFSSYEEFAAENAGKEIYGYTYDFLYESDKYVDWKKLGISYSNNGVTVPFTSEKLESTMSDIGYYAKRMSINYFGGDKIFTEEYALAIINFLGKLVYPNFTEVTSASAFKNGTTPDEGAFYRGIVEDSRIWEVIDKNWINTGIDFKSFLIAFGADVAHIPDGDYSKPKAISKALVEGIVSSFIAFGPIDFAFDLLETFSKSYSTALYDATTALFSMKIAAGKPVRDGSGKIIGRSSYGVEELESMEGLLTYVFDGVTDYAFFKFPGKRMSASTLKSEQYLYLLMYFAINYRFGANAQIVDKLASEINTFLTEGNRHSVAGYSYDEIVKVKGNVNEIINIIFKGDISDDAITFINGLSSENIEALPNDIFTQLKNWLAMLVKKIADYFDYVFKIFSGEIKYGDTVIEW